MALVSSNKTTSQGPKRMNYDSQTSKYKHWYLLSIKTMRISEILFWNNQPAEANDDEPQLDLAPARSSDDITNLATAFTRRGLVKHFWNLNGSERQPTGPAPPDAEPKSIPSSTLEPTAASRQPEPVETESSMGLQRLGPFRRYRGLSALTWPM
jgi:hypothetical protein